MKRLLSVLCVNSVLSFAVLRYILLLMSPSAFIVYDAPFIVFGVDDSAQHSFCIQ